MYLKLLLSNRLVEQRHVANPALMSDGYLQTIMQDMLASNAKMIDANDEQPQFILEKVPTKQKRPLIAKAKLLYSLLLDLF